MKSMPIVAFNKILLGICMSFIAFSCNTSGETKDQANQTTEIINKVSERYLPDDRINVFRVHLVKSDSVLIIKGATNLMSAKSALFHKLDSAGIDYIDSLRMLPDARVDSTPYAVVKISVANLRKFPKHPSELVTQNLMGFPMRVLTSRPGWHEVMGPDHYLGWVDNGGIQLMTAPAYQAYKLADKIIILDRTGTVWSKNSDSSDPVCDIVAGDILLLNGMSGNYFHVSLPDGRTGYVSKDAGENFSDFLARIHPTENSLVSTSKTLLGIPYLWGGTSVKGMDCSGFTKTVYFLNGIILPRDADQQAEVGLTVDSTGRFENLRPGDLLFFGQKRSKTSPEEITHVGMWIGNMSFINESGMVKLGSMDSLSENYDKYNLRRYVQSNRILGSQVPGIKSDSDLFDF